MRLPPNVDAEQATFGYIQALNGFPVEAIERGIKRFLRGEIEGISPKFCPHPPELANIVRGSLPKAEMFGAGRKLYGYHPPKSKLIERRCTKGFARQLVDQGVHPRGSIWCPGSLDDRPDIGDLYGPDPEWKEAFPIGDPKPEPKQESAE